MDIHHSKSQWEKDRIVRRQNWYLKNFKWLKFSESFSLVTQNVSGKKMKYQISYRLDVVWIGSGSVLFTFKTFEPFKFVWVLGTEIKWFYLGSRPITERIQETNNRLWLRNVGCNSIVYYRSFRWLRYIFRGTQRRFSPKCFKTLF